MYMYSEFAAYTDAGCLVRTTLPLPGRWLRPSPDLLSSAAPPSRHHGVQWWNYGAVPSRLATL